MWLKMIGTYVPPIPFCKRIQVTDSFSAVVLCVGGPALVQSIRPTNEELFKRYNPELQKRSLEEGDQRARDFDDYVTRLKEWSKSDKSSTFYILSPVTGAMERI